MFILKREALPIKLALIAGAAAMALSLTLVVPKAGAVTIAELMVQIQALQAQLVQLQAGSTTATTACTFTKSLYLGVSDPQVKCLQQYLNSAGYPVSASGAGSVGNETNYYGSLTKAAVAKWQAAMNVSPAAGYFGPISQAKYSSVAGTTGGTTGGVVTSPVGGGLSVGLSATTPAARSHVVGAANMPFGRWTFTAGSGNVTVTSLKFTRSGISADAEVSNAELYDLATGDYIAQYTGLGSGVLSFANTAGVFTVNAGTTKEVEMRIKNSGSNNHTMAWGLNAAADVVSNASSVSGTFPATSNAMTFVSVTDPAIATLTSAVVTTGSSVNAGTTGYLAGSFTLVAANSAVLLDRIVITQNGSIISGTDVTNVKLVTTGGQQLGSVLPNLSADGKGTFVMSPAYEIPSGQTIQVNVYADVVGGVNRTLIFNVLNLRDLQARDKTYNVGVSPSATLALTTTTVEAGTLTLTLDPSSPTGNIAPSQTNVTVLKVKVVAYGEQVKVLYIPFQIVTGGGTTDFTGQVDNIYMVDDAGNQIGTTITAADSSVAAGGTWDNNDSTAATFGTSSSNINYLIPANTTRIWSLKLDVVSTASSTMTTSLVAGTNNYQGQISNVSTGDTTAVGGNQLTITSSPFQAKQNSAFGAGNIVKGQTAAKIGSFVLSASSAEGINVSTITLTSSSTFPFANLMIKVNGVQFGDNKGSLLAATDYTFAGTSPVLIPAGGSVTVDAYVDVLTSATALGSSTYVKLDSASAVGALTASSQTLKTTGGDNVDNSNDIAGQSFTVNTTGGTMTIAKDAASPASYQAVMGKTGQSLGIWRFTGSAVSDTNITDMTVTASTSVSGAESSFENAQWYKGGVAVGPVVVSGTASGTAGAETGYSYTYHFTSPLVIPMNTGVSMELRGNVASFLSGGSTSNGQYIFRIESPDDVTALSSGGSLSVTVSGPNGGSGMDVNAITVVRTKLSVASSATYGGGANTIATTGHAPSAADVVAAFVFTADSANDVVINTVSLKLAGSTLVTLTVKLIDDETGSAWGSTPAAGLQHGIPTNVGAISTAAGTSTVIFRPAYTLSGSATKKVRVQVDSTGLTTTSGTTNGSLVQFYLDNTTSGSAEAGNDGNIIQCSIVTCNATGWNDGDTGGLNLEAKVLPIYAPAVRY